MDDPREIRAASGPVCGTFRVPASKSVLNRALACAALAGGESRIAGLSGCGGDVRTMIGGLRTLGICVREEEDGDALVVQGQGGAFGPPGDPVRVGEAGTAARILAALSCRAAGPVRLEAGPRMSVRPMEGLLTTLESLGAVIRREGERSFPFVVDGRPVRGGAASVDGTRTSQFTTALLLLAPSLPEGLSLRIEGGPVSVPYLRLTRQVMEAFGAEVREEEDGRLLAAAGAGYRPARIRAPGDASSALFLLAAAAVTGGEVRVEGIHGPWDQADLAALAVLGQAGCRTGRRGDVVICAGAPRRGIEADLTDCPDAAHALAMVAAVAPGPSLLTGLSTLPAKESDRLAALADGLRRMGGEARTSRDRIEILPRPLRGAEVDSCGDHRIAMAFAILGLRVPGVRVKDPGCAEKSWPRFWNVVEEIEPGTG